MVRDRFGRIHGQFRSEEAYFVKKKTSIWKIYTPIDCEDQMFVGVDSRPGELAHNLSRPFCF